MMKSDCEPFRSEDLCGQPKQAVASVLVWSRHGCLGRAFLLTDCTNMLPAQVAMPVSMSAGQRAVRQLVWGIIPAVASYVSACL